MLYQKRFLPAIALVLGCLGSGALGTDQKDNETFQFNCVKKSSTLRICRSFHPWFSAVDHLQIVSLVVNKLGHRKLHGF